MTVLLPYRDSHLHWRFTAHRLPLRQLWMDLHAPFFIATTHILRACESQNPSQYSKHTAQVFAAIEYLSHAQPAASPDEPDGTVILPWRPEAWPHWTNSLQLLPLLMVTLTSSELAGPQRLMDALDKSNNEVGRIILDSAVHVQLGYIATAVTVANICSSIESLSVNGHGPGLLACCT